MSLPLNLSHYFISSHSFGFLLFILAIQHPTPSSSLTLLSLPAIPYLVTTLSSSFLFPQLVSSLTTSSPKSVSQFHPIVKL
jgi:hypothetical protein